MDYLCPERLTPNLVWMANHLAAHDELEISPLLLEKLDQISTSTVQRILGRIPRDKPRLPRPVLTVQDSAKALSAPVS